jgi:hypothetical protein
MSVKRLHEGFGIGEDSCISGRHPMTEADLAAGQQGVYLARNPESPSKGLYVTFWEADDIAQAIGYPGIGVYEEQKKLIDDQAQRIAALEDQLNNEINSLQLLAFMKEVRKGNKEVLGALEATLAAVRSRVVSK